MDILSRYGIKEVADVFFHEINPDGSPGAPFLYLDTLKISNIEQSAQTVTAKGGEGNNDLFAWEFGRELTLKIQDALFSMRSLAMMFGAEPKELGEHSRIQKTVPISKVSGYHSSYKTANFDINGTAILADNVILYGKNGKKVTSMSAAQYATGEILIDGIEIDVTANTFPKEFYIIGETFSRSEQTGQDECFQFIVPRAKLMSELNLTMEADGDPSVFDMSLKVLKPKRGEMLKLIRYTPRKVVDSLSLASGYGKWVLHDDGVVEVFGQYDWNHGEIRSTDAKRMYSANNNKAFVLQIKDNIDVAQEAFASTNYVKKVEFIGDGACKIGPGAFMRNSTLTEVDFGSKQITFQEAVFGDIATRARSAAFAQTGVRSILVPGTIKNIPDSLFNYAEYLSSIKIDEGVESIGLGAFLRAGYYSGCSPLYIPSTMKTIGSVAFKDSGIRDIYLPYHSKGKITGSPWGSNATIHWKQ